MRFETDNHTEEVFLLDLAIRILENWPMSYRARTQLEQLCLQGASLAREAVADQAIRDALEADTLEQAKTILRSAQQRRITMF